ncbi:MAG: ExeM/NucH family extracellular endonuclease [Pseudomonadota bacterium]
MYRSAPLICGTQKRHSLHSYPAYPALNATKITGRACQVFVLATGMALSCQSQGAVLAEWDTAPSTENATLAPTTTDPSIDATQLSTGGGIIANSGGTWNWRDWDVASTDFDQAVAAGDFWTWGFTVTGGPITPETFDIRLDRSGSGPDDVEIRVSVNGGAGITVLTQDYGDSGSGVSFTGVDLSALGTLNTGDTVVFTLAAFNSESSGGTFDLETVDFGGADPRSLRIEGTVGSVGDLPPSVASTVPEDGATGVAVETDITITFSEPVTVTPDVWFALDCTVSGSDLPAVVSSGDSTTFVLDPVSDLAPGESCSVTITASNVVDQDETANNLVEDVSFSFDIAPDVSASPAVFINEFHYDNDGGDEGEFIEIAGPSGTDLTGWSIVLYNGNGGVTYGSPAVFSETLADETGTGFGFAVVSYPSNGIQNGPDGIALVDGAGNLVQFLSYEGSFVAANGPAAGVLSEDIGEREVGSTPIGDSLQLTGDGTTYADFVWAAPGPQTVACSNNEQTFAGGASECLLELTIPEIQGEGAASPQVSQTVVTTGVVTGDFQGVPESDRFHPDQLEGFFIQDVSGDGDPATSDGIFVSCDDCSSDSVSQGDVVTVTGIVEESFGLTSINVANNDGIMIDGAAGLPAPVLIDLPLSAVDGYEAFEGMLITFSDELFVSEYFQLGRFGEVVLIEGSRPYQFTHDNAPDTSGLVAFEAELETRRIILDDDANGSNQALFQDLNVFHPQPGLSTTNLFRGGDSITNLTGVLDFSFGLYRVRPIAGFSYEFTPLNTRATNAAPADVGGTLKVVSANVLNYFTTIDVTSGSDGDCSPSGTLDCRGADSALELARQTEKLTSALCAIDGDIVGLSEIENDASGTGSLSTLATALTTAGCGPYDFVDAGPLGTDAIKVAFLYNPDTVTPVAGQSYVVDNSIDPDYQDNRNRPTLVQVFEEIASGGKLIVAAHHLKSKGSDCDDLGDPDLNDGQGNCSQTRARAAQIVVDYINNTVIPAAGTDRVLAIGDLNAYKREDAVRAYIDAGYVDLVEEFGGDDAYSFVFGGQLGYLDHALGLNLGDAVTGTTEWHINADEISLFDYNDDIRDEGERSFEEEPDNLPLYDPGPWRSSDHDPVIVGLTLGSSASVDGDLDGDGDVDFDDYRALLSVFRLPASASPLAAVADFDGSGTVDIRDLLIWRGFLRAFRAG